MEPLESHLDPSSSDFTENAARLESLQAGDGVVLLGQAQPGPGLRFLAHAITARTR